MMLLIDLSECIIYLVEEKKKINILIINIILRSKVKRLQKIFIRLVEGWKSQNNENKLVKNELSFVAICFTLIDKYLPDHSRFRVYNLLKFKFHFIFISISL